MPVSVSYSRRLRRGDFRSGVRTIAGVATSITAFVGKALRGPVDEPSRSRASATSNARSAASVLDSPLGYAVRDFFVNGGAQAVIVRLYKKPDRRRRRARRSRCRTTSTLQARQPGGRGACSCARASTKGGRPIRTSSRLAQRLGVAPADVFDLTVRDGITGPIETFLNLTTKESARRADRVLAAESSLARVGAASVPADASPASTAVVDRRRRLDRRRQVHAAPRRTPPTARRRERPRSDGRYKGTPRTRPGSSRSRRPTCSTCCASPPTPAAATCPTTCTRRRWPTARSGGPCSSSTPRPAWTTVAAAQTGAAGMGLNGDAARNAAIYFPRIRQADPMRDGHVDTFAASGMVAGVMARTDASAACGRRRRDSTRR